MFVYSVCYRCLLSSKMKMELQFIFKSKGKKYCRQLTTTVMYCMTVLIFRSIGMVS